MDAILLLVVIETRPLAMYHELDAQAQNSLTPRHLVTLSVVGGLDNGKYDDSVSPGFSESGG